MSIDKLRPIEPRPDVAPVERVQLTRAERDAEREQREQRRRKRRDAAPERPGEDAPGGLDIRV